MAYLIDDDGSPVDLASKDISSVCKFCDERDEIIFPSIKALMKTIDKYWDLEKKGVPHVEFFIPSAMV